MPRLACHSIGSALDDHDMPRLTPRLINLVVIVLPKLLLWMLTAQSGTTFLMAPRSLSDVEW